MNTTTMLIKTDKEVKAAAQDAAREIGIPLGTVMGMYLRRFARERRIEFEAPLVPNAKTAKALRRSQKEFEQGKSHGPFATVEELFESLER
jgi:addiction module RelB/DinJ family antitoxin